MTKKEFSAHISANWILYLVTSILVFVISSWVITATAEPNKKEKVTIFVTSYNTSSELKEYLTSKKDDYLKAIEINSHSINDDYYTTFLQALITSTDIMIVPESMVEMVSPQGYLELNDEMMKNVTDKKLEYYTLEGMNFGIKIHTSGKDDGILKDYITYTGNDSDGNIVDENYYLFIRKDSLHMGILNDSEFSGGITILKEMLEYENQKSE